MTYKHFPVSFGFHLVCSSVEAYQSINTKDSCYSTFKIRSIFIQEENIMDILRRGKIINKKEENSIIFPGPLIGK